MFDFHKLKADCINEIKNGEFPEVIELIQAIAEDAKQYDKESIVLEKENWDGYEKGLSKQLGKMTKEERAKYLKGADDLVDKYQSGVKKMSNVPALEKTADRLDSRSGSGEAGVKVGRVANKLGIGPEGTSKAMVKTTQGIEAIKGAGRSVADKVKDVGEKISDKAVAAKSAVAGGIEKVGDKASAAGEKVSDAASKAVEAAKESGGAGAGLAAAGIGAGLGALALAKKLRKGKQAPA